MILKKSKIINKNKTIQTNKQTKKKNKKKKNNRLLLTLLLPFPKLMILQLKKVFSTLTILF